MRTVWQRQATVRMAAPEPDTSDDSDLTDPGTENDDAVDAFGEPSWFSVNTLNDEIPSEDGVQLYFRDIGRARLLTADEEIQLARQLEAGRAAAGRLTRGVADTHERRSLEEAVQTGEAARRRLTESNLRLVVSIARKYTGHGLHLLDLIQEGNIGLQRAVAKYDWRRGFRFSTYAYWWIRQAVGRAIFEHSRAFRLPAHAGELVARVSRTAQDLQLELERTPTLDEIAERLCLPVDRVRSLASATKAPISLETPVGDEGESTVADLLADPASAIFHEQVEERLLSEQVERMLRERLTAREAAMVRLRFGLGGTRERTLAEIGEDMGVSRERVRQLEAKVLQKLRATPSLRSLFYEYAG